MPKARFLNLPTEKREVIMNAALNEFSKHNIHEASVANIVRESQIARGSFYKYFEDIEDLYQYLYHAVTKEAHGSVIDALKKADGDLFKGLEIYLDDLILAFSDERYHEYFKVVTLNLNYATSAKLSQHTTQDVVATTSSHDFTQFIRTDTLRLSSHEELTDFFKVLVPMVHECLSDYFTNDWNHEELKSEYNKRLNWLKYGILK